MRLGKRKWLLIVLCLGIAVAAWQTYLIVRRQQLGPFASELPDSVELKLWLRDHRKDPLEVRIDSPQAIKELIEVWQAGVQHEDHKCASTGRVTLNYGGSQVTITILPGHNLASYEFRHRGRNYSVNRERFLAALKRGGVDLNIIAKNPDDLPVGDGDPTPIKVSDY